MAPRIFLRWTGATTSLPSIRSFGASCARRITAGGRSPMRRCFAVIRSGAAGNISHTGRSCGAPWPTACTGRNRSKVQRDPMDDKIKQLLRDLGNAINESISASDDVNQHIQRIRDEGYNLYVVLDATIGLNKEDGEGEQTESSGELTVKSDRDVSFRINVNDLALLRAIGIDPTRKVRSTRRIEPL